mgnify:CR=1 FL=1
MLEKSKYEAQINDIIKISVNKIYRSKEVIEKEIAGLVAAAGNGDLEARVEEAGKQGFFDELY